MDEVRASGGGVALRLFASLHIAAAAAERLADREAALVGGMPGVHALAADELLVTFAWLGDVAEEHVPAVAAALDRVAASIPGATGCSVVGARFLDGGRRHAAIVDVELLAMIDSARDTFLDAVAPFAPSVDRGAWKPHVTLSRGIGAEPLPASVLEAAPQPAPATWVARELALHASLPGPVGRHHRMLHASLLGTELPAHS